MCGCHKATDEVKYLGMLLDKRPSWKIYLGKTVAVTHWENRQLEIKITSRKLALPFSPTI